MSTLKPARKISRKERLREDTVVTFYARAVGFFDQNRNLVYGVGVGILVVILGLIGWSYLGQQREARAADAVAPAIKLYEEGFYREALDGVAGSEGLLALADEFGSTTAGNLARFYAADALFRLGEFDRALEYFRRYDKQADYLGASATAGEASILETRGEHADAARLYERAADLHGDDDFSPIYLLEAGRAYEAAGQYDRAVRVYERVQDEYPDAQANRDTEFLIARARAKERN